MGQMVSGRQYASRPGHFGDPVRLVKKEEAETSKMRNQSLGFCAGAVRERNIVYFACGS